MFQFKKSWARKENATISKSRQLAKSLIYHSPPAYLKFMFNSFNWSDVWTRFNIIMISELLFAHCKNKMVPDWCISWHFKDWPPYPSSVLVNTAAFHKSKLLQHWSHSASLTSSDWEWNYWNWLHVLAICSFSVGLGGVKGIIIHNFPDFLLQDGNNFCWHKQVCLIQVLYNKLFPQNYFLIQVKKKLLHCRITTKKGKIQLTSTEVL